MIDVYERAKEFDIDIIDKDGTIYKVQHYNNCLRLGLPVEGIRVYNYYGDFMGYAKRNTQEKHTL